MCLAAGLNEEFQPLDGGFALISVAIQIALLAGIFSE